MPASPAAIALDIDDSCDRVHGHQKLSLLHTRYETRFFRPVHVYPVERGKRVAANLGVEGVYDAPQQVLALIGDVEAVGGRARGDDAEGFGHRPYGVVTAPDIAVVELAALRRRAKEWAFSLMVEVTEVSVKGSISKVTMMAAIELALNRTGRYPAVMDCWDTLAQGSRA